MKPRPVSPDTPVLVVDALKVLHVGPVSFSVDRGECVALWGASGTGKSLLLRGIADLTAHQGRALLRGQPAASVPAPAWRQRVSLLPAESAWWRDRVGDHFTIRPDRWAAALDLPDQVWDWPLHRLSTGEKQRLAIVRMLQHQPRVLLLDEPTANLDPPNRDRVEALVTAYLEEHGAAAVWVGHDPAQRKRVATRRFQLISGQLQEDAGP